MTKKHEVLASRRFSVGAHTEDKGPNDDKQLGNDVYWE